MFRGHRVSAAFAAALTAAFALAGAGAADAATPCPGNPNALGTSRVMAIDAREFARIGTVQYSHTLPLADKEVVTADPKSSPDSSGGSSQVGALVFMSDASAEAERLSAALRARGYWVVDVPLGVLTGRVAVQRPALVVTKRPPQVGRLPAKAEVGPIVDVVRRIDLAAAGQRRPSQVALPGRRPHRSIPSGPTARTLATFPRA